MAETGAEMVRLVRRIRDQFDIPPARVWNFDEVRIYSSPQDLHSRTLEFQSVRDPYAKKVANPKEGYTGIVMCNGSGTELMVFLVTTKKIPPEFVVHSMTLQERSWEDNQVKVTDVEVQFGIIHGVTVLKVPPGRKAWCSTLVTQAYLRLALFRIPHYEKTLIQVKT